MLKFANSRIRQLYSSKTRRYGRNNSGHITVAHIGGRINNSFKLLDLRRALNGERGLVVRIEFDPNRTAFLGLVYFVRLGLFTYILLPEGMKIGGRVHVFNGRVKNFDYKSYIGSSFPMAHIPLSTPIHNVEGGLGGAVARGGRIARAGGTFSKIIRRVGFGQYVGLSLPSGKLTFLPSSNLATIGQVSNVEHRFDSLLLAGRGVRLGRRPRVRGVAMNPVDHPHGGGEGKTSGGRPSVSKWGWLTKGRKTRDRRKSRREKLWITQLNKLV